MSSILIFPQRSMPIFIGWEGKRNLTYGKLLYWLLYLIFRWQNKALAMFGRSKESLM